MSDNWLEEFLQEKVNEVATRLIKECPEIAKNDPKRIGKMAKAIVFEAASQAVDQIVTEAKNDSKK